MRIVKAFIILAILIIESASVFGQADYCLATDQSFYFSGEEVRLTILTGLKRRDELVSLSMVNGEVVTHHRNVLIKDGVGSEVIKLANDLPPGSYAIFLHSGHVPIGSSSIQVVEPQKSTETFLGTNSAVAEGKLVNVKGLTDSIFTNQEVNLELLLRKYRLEEAVVNVSISNRQPAIPEQFNNVVFEDPYASRRSIQVEGTLLGENRTPLKDRPFNVLIPSTLFSTTGRTDSEGNFKIKLRADESEFFCIFSSVLGSEYGIEQIDVKKLAYTSSEESQDSISIDVSRFVENNIINNAFSPYKGTLRSSSKSKNDTYIDRCNHVVDPDEFVTFGTIGEMLHEILPRVRVKDDRVRIVPDETPRPLKNPVLFVIDGVPTYNKDYILSLDQSAIDSIGVISSLSSIKPFRQAGTGGIIVFKMNDAFDPGTVQVSGNIIAVQGHDEKENKPYVIDEETISFSSLLYWNERIDLAGDEAKEMKFRTSYESGTYFIHLNGISDQGVFSEVQEFTVHQRVR